MTDPVQAALVADAQRALHRWGVWDKHEQRWLVEDLPSEREAWGALLAVDSLHPWELIVDEKSAVEASPDSDVECPKCSGAGTCWNCDQECPHCKGDGYISAKQHAEDLAAEKARNERLAQYRAEREAKAAATATETTEETARATA